MGKVVSIKPYLTTITLSKVDNKQYKHIKGVDFTGINSTD